MDDGARSAEAVGIVDVVKVVKFVDTNKEPDTATPFARYFAVANLIRVHSFKIDRTVDKSSDLLSINELPIERV